MNSTKELNRIKKLYGERFMHLCRQLFPTILEQEGLLIEVLTSNFATNTRSLYEDIVNSGLEDDFKSYIYSKIDVEGKKPRIIEEKTPYELLEEAGYDLYECKTEEEIQSFRKYYKTGEELCTFQGSRLSRCVVFFAVKKDVDKIKREDFENPKREDEYGTSVMSIQFPKKGICNVSIKNRYNHTVNNPDATYGNDLDMIIPGLKQSFKDLLAYRGLDLNDKNVESFHLPGYVIANDGKYYKYNMELNGIYYCAGNTIIDNGKIIKLESEKQELLDYFIVDKQNKKITLYDPVLRDSFTSVFKDITSIEVKKDKNAKKRVFSIRTKNNKKPIIVAADNNNSIIEYENENSTNIGNLFLTFNKNMKSINIPNVITIGDGFLYSNEELKSINLPNTDNIGTSFLSSNEKLEEINMPNLTKAGEYFLYLNKGIKSIDLPKLISVGCNFLADNEKLDYLSLPSLTTAGSGFLVSNIELQSLNLPSLHTVGDRFLYLNRVLSSINLPKLTEVGNRFLYNNKELTSIRLPSLTTTKNDFLFLNEGLTSIDTPNLTTVGNDFLYTNKELEAIEMPNLTRVGDSFLQKNERLRLVNLPNLISTGRLFLPDKAGLKEIDFPKLNRIGEGFYGIGIPLRVVVFGEISPYSNPYVEHVNLPHLPSSEYEKLPVEVSELIKSKEKIVSSKDITELDKETQLTTQEVRGAKSYFDRIRSFFRGNER